MPPTTGYSFGDVVLVSFPFTDRSTTKRRPAVVVSSEDFHRGRSDLIVAAVTSQPRGDRLGEATIARWREAGLLKPSVVKPVLATLDSRLVVRRLGRLIEDDRNALHLALRQIIGWTESAAKRSP